MARQANPAKRTRMANSGHWRYRHPVATPASSSRPRLPRGRSALPADEVDRIHRQRLCLALAEEMAENGYVHTSVASVLKRAGVSRRAFYELFDDKRDCFLAAFDYAGKILRHRMLEAGGMQSINQLDSASDPMALFEIAITAYLDALAAELPFAKLFLIESYVVGLAAIKRRTEVQESIATMLAALMGVTGPKGRFTCVMFVMAVASKVSEPVAAGDREAIRALAPELIAHVRGLWAAGAFSEPDESLMRWPTGLDR